MSVLPAFPIGPLPGTRPFGDVASLLETHDGGQVFLLGDLQFSWDAGGDEMRRLVAVQLFKCKIATAEQFAEAFGIAVARLWRWSRCLAQDGIKSLAS